MSAHCYGSVFHIPETRDKLRQCRFARTRRADESRHTVLRNEKADAVENFFIVVIAERNVLDLDAVIAEADALSAVFLFLGFEDFIDLRNGRADKSQSIDKVKCRNYRRRHTEREDDNRDESLNRERTANIKQPSERKYRQHLRREKGICH